MQEIDMEDTFTVKYVPPFPDPKAIRGSSGRPKEMITFLVDASLSMFEPIPLYVEDRTGAEFGGEEEDDEEEGKLRDGAGAGPLIETRFSKILKIIEYFIRRRIHVAYEDEFAIVFWGLNPGGKEGGMGMGNTYTKIFREPFPAIAASEMDLITTVQKLRALFPQPNETQEAYVARLSLRHGLSPRTAEDCGLAALQAGLTAYQSVGVKNLGTYKKMVYVFTDKSLDQGTFADSKDTKRYNEAKGAILTRLSDLTEGGTYFKIIPAGPDTPATDALRAEDSFWKHAITRIRTVRQMITRRVRPRRPQELEKMRDRKGEAEAPPNEEEGEEEEGEGEEGEWAAGEPFDDGDEYEEEEGWGGVESILDLDSISARAHKGRPAARAMLEVCPSLSIPLRLYIPAKGAYQDATKGRKMDVKTGDLVKSVTTRLDINKVAHEPPPSEFVEKGYGSMAFNAAPPPLIHYEKKKEKFMAATVLPAKTIRILGFKPMSCLEDWHVIGTAHFAVPDTVNSKGSEAPFNALLYQMDRKKVFAIAARTGIPSARGPALCALVPDNEGLAARPGGGGEGTVVSEKAVGFAVYPLAYSGGLRPVVETYRRDLELHLTELRGKDGKSKQSKEKAAHARHVLAALANVESEDRTSGYLKANQEEVAAAARAIRPLNLNPFFYEKLENPHLQRYFNVVERKALGYAPSAQEPVEDKTLPDVSLFRDEKDGKPSKYRRNLEIFDATLKRGLSAEEREALAATELERANEKKRKLEADKTPLDLSKIDWYYLLERNQLGSNTKEVLHQKIRQLGGRASISEIKASLVEKLEVLLRTAMDRNAAAAQVQ